jgi:hypothetical protein
MEKFVPYEKLSKKKKRELDAKRRGSWYGINPVTRKPENSKAYNRRKARTWSDDSLTVSFLRLDARKVYVFDGGKLPGGVV